jgi:hypothetical protein
LILNLKNLEIHHLMKLSYFKNKKILEKNLDNILIINDLKQLVKNIKKIYFCIFLESYNLDVMFTPKKQNVYFNVFKLNFIYSVIGSS